MKKYILGLILLLGMSLLHHLQAQVAGRTADQFRVNESGAASYQIPIMTSPGTRGMGPNLSFVYSSQQGNGHMGLGWALGGLSVITRAPATKAQDNEIDGVDFDRKDRFTLDGERLVNVSGSYGYNNTQYRTEQEAFAKIVSYGTAGKGPQKFKVWTKDGMIREYGYTTNSRIEAQGKSDVLIWRLNKVTDRQGNYYTFTYGEINGNTESYPTRIDYTGNASRGLATYASVRFEYESRSDVNDNYLSGVKVKFSKRLKRVRSYYGNSLVRTYTMTYTQQGSAYQSLLTQIQECGTNGSCKEAIRFDWGSMNENGQFNIKSPYPNSGYGVNANNYKYIPGDFNGDGKGDLFHVVNNNYGRVWQSNGNGTFSIKSPFPNSGYALSANNYNFIPGDFNGDGKTDMFHALTGGSGHVWQSNGNGTFSIKNKFTSPSNLPNITFKPGDFNGDGRTDLALIYNINVYGFVSIQLSMIHAIWLSNGNGTFTVQSPFGSGTYGAPLQFLYKWDFADFNGDGLTDIVQYTSNSGLTVWMSKGDGTFELKPSFPNNGYNVSSNGYKFLPGDFNGDGMADLVHIVNNNYLRVWESKGDGTFSIRGLYPNTGYALSANGYNFRVGDFNGDGKSDLVHFVNNNYLHVWYSRGNGTFNIRSPFPNSGYAMSANGYAFTTSDFTGDGKTDLLHFVNHRYVHVWEAKPDTRFQITKITNVRKEVRLTYKPLTDASAYSKYSSSTYPKMDIQAPMQVVSRVQTSNGIGGFTTVDYKYEGAYIDLQGRGFRGFKKITASNITTGLKEITEFERDHRCVNSKVKKSEQRLISNNRLISQTVNTISYRTTFSGKVNWSWVSRSVMKSYKLNGSLVTTTTTNFTYDSYGNLTKEATTFQGGHTKTTDRYYYNNTSSWILGQLTSERFIRRRSGQPTLTRRIDYSYNSARTLMTRETIEPAISSLRITKDYLYDGYGNITRTTLSGNNGYGLETRIKQFTYDSRGRFQTRKTNELGHTRNDVYDNLHGNVTQSTGPNGIKTTYTYDAFGRKLTQYTPGGGTITYTYARISSGNEIYYVQEAAQGKPTQRTYYDVLGRETRMLRKGFSGSWIYQTNIYDSKGRLWKMSEPYYSGTSAKYTVSEYDALHRMTRETAPGSRVRTISYNGLTQTITNPNGQQLIEKRDAIGNLLQTTNHIGKHTYQYYDSFDNLIEIRDGNGTRTYMQYDLLGRKTRIQDPNAGVVLYTYNAFNELVTEKNARNQTTTFRYDKLGRLTQRVEPEGTTTWTYDVGNKAKSRLYRVTGPGGYQETYSYDSYSRLYKTSYAGPGGTFNIQTSYDSYGRPSQVTYPSNFRSKNLYNASGYLYEVRNASNNAKFWTLEAQSARDQWERTRAGNNKVTNYYYDSNRGVVTRIYTAGVQDLRFTFDKIGNLTQRRDAARSLTENFLYDGINRVISTHAGGGGSTTVTYDAAGNITYRSDAGCYEYGAGVAGPQAVTRLKDNAGGTLKTFTYDASGNMTRNHQTNILYTTYNKPYRLTKGSDKIEIDYGPGRSRQTQRIYKSNALHKTIRYVGSIYEKHTGAGGTKYIHHIMAGDKVVAVHTTGSGAGTRYLHRDHIGSIQTITNESGGVVDVLSYNAWGQRRNPYTWQASNSISASFIRGFTGHEHLDMEDLIHMGARIYDASIGRFLSADPFVSFEGTGQSLNRYSYVMNNPLSLVDPSGFFFKKLFRALKRIVKSIFKNPLAFIVGVVAAVVTFGVVNPILTSALGGGFWGGLGAAVLSGAAAGAAGSFGATLVATGDLGMALKAGLMGGLTGALSGGLMYGIDQILPTWMQTSSIARPNNPLSASKRIQIQIGRSLTTSGVNGLMNKIRGGEFADGFMVSMFGDMIRWGRDAFVEWRALKQFRETGWPTNQADQAQFLEDAGATLRPSEGWESDVKSHNGQYVSVINPRTPNVGIPRNSGFLNRYATGENSAFMKIVSKIPGMNSMSIAHDYFADFASPLGINLLTSQATIPLFMGIEYASLLSEPQLYYIRGN
ncbi:MAG: FG-GAP-like repeat-containing protein [Bacteroidota bacterium]